MAVISLISGELANVCVESFLYGIFFLLSIVSMWLLVHRLRDGSRSGSGPRIRDATPPTSIMIFIGAGHWLTVVIRLFDAFVNFEGGANPLLFYANFNQPTEVVQSAALITVALINDTIIIYRLWVIWSYDNRVIVFPVCTLIGLTICGYGSTYQLTRMHIGEDIFVSAAGRWLTSNCVFTLCTNVYSTVMIAWRIWRVNKASKAHGGGNLTGPLAIVVESAALYTTWTIFFLVTYEAQTNLQFVSNCGLPMVAGISFMLINVRVGLGWAQRAPRQDSLSEFAAAGRSTQADDQAFSMHQLAVSMQSTSQHSDQKKLPSVLNGGYAEP
ncbi:uncharacterized protein LAESUDRAFT_655170 [Laetiporus sulphureus 93-53]|uniref:Uncharacterized protein n=1 Tax=Laetiporus sulphureus 93-53 TaxID=1314785 RepID=A0A165DWM4_9APHY|nr:uncharacterized protein LAESUDRAFT_655170 [Laetiporus sulphureus 93-53]KZT05781.1 hypothetical protein LAESUDRAFT_655170 [Laetiporus sulphureus 93-53]